MKARKSRQTEVVEETPSTWGLHTGLIAAVVFLAPMVAGRLTPIPALSLQILVIAAAAVWLLHSAREGRIELPSRPILALSGLMLLLMGLSALDSVSVGVTLHAILGAVAYLLVFLMVAGMRPTPHAALLMLGTLVISTVFVGLWGLREFMLTGDPGWRVFATFFNPDFLAGFMSMMLPIALGWYLSRTSPAVALVAGLGVLLAFGNLLMSGSRFGAVAAFGGVIVFLILALLSRSIRKPQLVRASILVLPMLIVFLTLGGPLMGRVASVKAESHSGGFRIHTWKGTARMAAANPFNGTGLGAFEIAYPKHASVGYTKLAHNSYLQLAGEAGPASAVVLLILLGAVTVPAAVSVVHDRSNRVDEGSNVWMPERGLIMSGIVGGAAASMARNLVDSDWYVAAIGIAFAAIMGAAVALGSSEGVSASISRKDAGWGTAGLGLFALCGVLMLAAAVSFEQGGAALMDQDPEAAMAAYQDALRFDPANAEYRRRLSRLYLMIGQGTDDESYVRRAEQQLKHAVALEPTYAKNHYQLARLYEVTGRDAAAVKSFRKALECDPNALDVQFALARRFEAMDRRDDAMTIWKRIAALEDSPYGRIRAIPELVEPEYAFARVAIGRKLEAAGDPNAAREQYSRALDRIERYQASIEEMSDILDISGRRNTQMEDEVEELRAELVRVMNDE